MAGSLIDVGGAALLTRTGASCNSCRRQLVSSSAELELDELDDSWRRRRRRGRSLSP